MENNKNQNRPPQGQRPRQQNNRPQQQQNNRPKRFKNPDPMGNPVAMGKFAMKIIKDIAFGKCNIESYYSNFQNPIFIQSAINEVREKIANESIYQISLNAFYIQYGDPRAHNLLKKHNNAIYAWNLVQEVLYQIAQTGDPSPLIILANRLPQFKHSM